MTEKQFKVIDYFDSKNKPIKAIKNTKTTEIYSMDNELEANSICECFNALHEENKALKQQLEYEQEVIVNAIDSLMDLPSASMYLFKQWLDVLENYDSIEDMKNTFSERIKELEE